MVVRTICVVTGSRAEYGLLKPVMEALRDAPQYELRVVAAASHLSPAFGLTARGVEADGFTLDAQVDMLLSSDTAVGVATSMGLGLIGWVGFGRVPCGSAAG